MERLSVTKYGWKFVIGAEAAYLICLFGGFLPIRNPRALELHRMLFETIPGFTWISTGSALLEAFYVFIIAWVLAWYGVWMYNSSLEKQS